MEAEDEYIKMLCNEITTAFVNISKPLKRDIFGRHLYVDDERSGVLELIAGRDWWSLSHDDLVNLWISLPAFSPKAYQYYLPAFLRDVVMITDESSMILQTVLFTLTPPEEAEAAQFVSFNRKIKKMTHAQIRVICHVLTYLQSLSPHIPNQSDITRSNFWCHQQNVITN